MNYDELVRAVKSFADRPKDVSVDSGSIIAEIHDEIFEVKLKKRHGNLICEEKGKEYTAWEWMIERLGRFEQLANRIIDYVPKDDLFIPVEGDVVDVLDEHPDEEGEHTENAVSSVLDLMGSELIGSTKVVYLTSDAGEGKTSLINHISRIQAQSYLDGETDWLMLPVRLAGRPLIRLDDVVIGTLSNRLRFPYYYFESVIELVRQKAIVIALDGFEEMFIETRTGDAVTSLGNLVTQLNSQGRLLVAARSAYYNYRDFEAHAKLFKSIDEEDVSFAEVSLRRWSKEQFCMLAEKAGLTDGGEELYEQIANRLNDDHPLLTRAVLARRLIEEYVMSDDRDDLVDDLSQASGEEYFDRFVDRLIHREANEKWIDRSAITGEGEAAQPLLTTEQHHAVLSAISEEMWRNGVESLNVDYLEEITEVIVEVDVGMDPELIDQARDRITQHALLVNIEGSNLYRFDHDYFKNYYLGRYLADLLHRGRMVEVKSALEVKTLPDLTVRVCVMRFCRNNEYKDKIIDCVDEICEIGNSGRNSSFLKVNAGKIVLSLLSNIDVDEPVTVNDIYISSNHIESVGLENIEFEKCTFERLILEPENTHRISINESSVPHAVLVSESESYERIFIDENSLPEKLTLLSDVGSKDPREWTYYNPENIGSEIGRVGINVGDDDEEVSRKEPIEPELEVKIVDRVFRYYQRSTSLGENILKRKLGDWWGRFEEQVLPDLLEQGVLRRVKHTGSGDQRRYRLESSFEDLERARKNSNGEYSKLVDALGQTT
jgi:hypothetical protein